MTQTSSTGTTAGPGHRTVEKFLADAETSLRHSA